MYKNIILIPYRNRQEHLNLFLKQTISLFSKYLKPFKIIVIEQLNEKKFNRAILLNIGYLLYKDETTFLFHHDVDLIPMEETIKNLYTDEKYDILRIYNGHNSSLGGVVKFKKEIYEQINGLPNYIWGWGIEDRAFYYRCITLKLNISNNFTNKDNFLFLKHSCNGYIFEEIKKRISENENYIYHNETKENKIKHMLSSGLNNLNFEIIAKKQLNQFTTLIQVDI
jgi:hypothetical protein